MAKAGCQNLIPSDSGCLQMSMLVFQKQWVTRKRWHILQLNVGEKKAKCRMLLSTVFYWFLSWWLFSDTILTWLKGHNWEEGTQETISYYCENRRGYWHGMKKSGDEVIIPLWITKPQWVCEVSDGSKMWLSSGNHTTWDGLIAILQVSKEKKKCACKDKLAGQFGKHDASTWTAVRAEPCNLERKPQCWINTINTQLIYCSNVS